MLFDPAPGPLSIVSPLLRKGTTMSHTTSLPRLVVLPFVVLLLSLGLTFGTGKAAQAYVQPSVPVAIGTTLASPPARAIAMGVCAGAALVCAGVGVGILGLTAYATKDSWMPLVAGAFSDDGTATESPATSSNGACTVSWVAGPNLTAAKNALTGTFAVGGCSASYITNRVNWEGLTCKYGSTHVSGVNGQLGLTSFNSGQGGFTTGDLCPGGVISQATVYVTHGSTVNGTTSKAYIRHAHDPQDIQQTTEVVCRYADGSSVTISDTEYGHDSRVTIPSCADRQPGSIPWSGTIKAGPKGGTEKTVQTWTSNQDVMTEYADCFTEVGLVCTVKVWLDGQVCAVGQAGCVDWLETYQTDPSRVRCKFGGYNVGIGQCNPLKRAYQPSTGTKTITQTKPDGTTDYGTDSPAPSTSTGGVPETGTNPGTAPGTAPEAEPDSASCWGEGWSWNPVSWVYVPVKCALKWAFVPSVGFMDAELADLRADLDGTEPAKWLAVWDDFDAGQGMTGCEGLEFKTPAIDGVGVLVDGRIGEACSGKMADYAGMVRLGISLVVVVCGGIACINGLLAGFGMNKVLSGPRNSLEGHEVNA